MKYLLDTNVYFAGISDRSFLERYRNLLERVMPRTWLSSVVKHEMVRGAKGDLGREVIRRVTRALERVGRVVSPEHTDWTAAAIAQGKIWDGLSSRRTQDLQNDLLIASSARRIGAVVVTENRADFELIARYLPHASSSMADLARALCA